MAVIGVNFNGIRGFIGLLETTTIERRLVFYRRIRACAQTLTNRNKDHEYLNFHPITSHGNTTQFVFLALLI